MFYNKTEYVLQGFTKSNQKDKMYSAILKNIKTKKIVKVSFGSNSMQNFHDKTGLNLYPHLIHGDLKRRKAFRSRFKGFLRPGYYSGAYFSYNYLW